MADLHTLQFTVAHTPEFSVFSNLILATDFYKSHSQFKPHMKSSLHSIIPFLPLFCNCQLSLNSSDPKLVSWQAGVSKMELTLLNWALLSNHFAWTTQKTQPLYCWGGVFTAPLRNNGSYSIADFVFVAAGISLPSRCVAINVYSDFTMPAFRRHVTIFTATFTKVGWVKR
jgi:hypothetical protein